MPLSRCHHTIHAVLQALHLQPTETVSEHGIYYLLRVATLQIELQESRSGQLTLQCCAGQLETHNVAALSVLLAENHYQEDGPTLSVSLLTEAPDNVLIWSRLAAAEVGQSALGHWLMRFIELARALQCWLACGAPALESPLAISAETTASSRH